MIYTITLSPSIDYYVSNDKKFNSKGLNRIDNFSVLAGGKGINSSIILKRHGYDNTAITFLGGLTGNLINDLLKKEKINVVNIPLEKDTRINVKYFDKNNHFEINGPKSKISNKNINNLKKKLVKLNSNDLVFIMGISEEKTILDLVKFLSQRKVKIVIDIDSKIIFELLKFKPYLIKPNIDELGSLFNEKIKKISDVKNYMKKLHEMGAENIIVSMGSKGSCVLSNNDFIHFEGQKADKVISTVGAGDTMISLFAAKKLEGASLKDSLLFATAGSLGTVSSIHLSDAKKTKYYLEKIKNII
ncbi:MAG: 1-phosphofructokinase [Mycoplasmoidaceae bacterium]